MLEKGGLFFLCCLGYVCQFKVKKGVFNFNLRANKRNYNISTTD